MSALYSEDAGVDAGGEHPGEGVGCPCCGGDEWFSADEGDICRGCGWLRPQGVSEGVYEGVHAEVEEEKT